ncbi:unnamed protein product [Darwinula stevensoni]|uniref:Uncharacterized protein n=1 Tax=Darwinula stevensoni TaxID=69355 RepID=A0A7R9A186_9CRUS|nr:unnamed protein product [Darwinula stevensoni]CAG0882935.1 unnamed protein product [Darwinula stevensoni]
MPLFPYGYQGHHMAHQMGLDPGLYANQHGGATGTIKETSTVQRISDVTFLVQMPPSNEQVNSAQVEEPKGNVAGENECRKAKGMPKSESSSEENEEEKEQRRKDAIRARREAMSKKVDKNLEKRGQKLSGGDKERLQQGVLDFVSERGDLTANIDDLARRLKVSGNIIRTIIEEDSRFLLRKNMVSLNVKLSTCEKYLTSGECEETTCQSLHICPKYLYDLCSDVSCEDGHSIDTYHNQSVLSRLNMTRVKSNVLRKFLPPDTVAPDLCDEYNLNKICSREGKCLKMHICALYVTGACKICHLNHNIFDPQCQKLLKQANIQLKRAKKELKTFLRRKCTVSPEEIGKRRKDMEREHDQGKGQHGLSSKIQEASWRPAEYLKKKGKCIRKGKPSLYEIHVEDVMKDAENRTRKCVVHFDSAHGDKEVKVIILLGATGAGKSTLVNAFINYFYGVDWEDTFRLVLIPNIERGKSKGESQTSWITAYTFPWQKGCRAPYSITIVDTPGLGDTKGLIADKHITFKESKPLRLQTRTAVAKERLALDSTANNPAIKDRNDQNMNSAISAEVAPLKGERTEVNTNENPENAIHQAIARRDPGITGNASTSAGSAEIGAANAPRDDKSSDGDSSDDDESEERQFLEAALQSIEPQLMAGLGKLEELRQEHAVLKKYEVELNASENVMYTVKVQKQKQVDKDPGEYVTKCLRCNLTCHDPCTLPQDKMRDSCSSMVIDMDTGAVTHCAICPSKCPPNQHVNNQYRMELYEETETRLISDFKEKYEMEAGKKLNVEGITKALIKEFNQERANIMELIKRAYECLCKLDRMSTSSKKMGILDYLNLLISTEKKEARPGHSQRIKFLQDTQAKAQLAETLKGDFDLLKEYTKEFEIEGFSISLFDPDSDEDDTESDSTSLSSTADEDEHSPRPLSFIRRMKFAFRTTARK